MTYEEVEQFCLTQASRQECLALFDALRARHRSLLAYERKKAMRQVEVGMRVKFPGTTRPQYLQNQAGKIVSVKSSRVVVELDAGPMGKFRNGRVIAAPESLVVLTNPRNRGEHNE